ncbi:ABC transporter A like protein [Aduncisulcus paluster]|uniref:ABC transporter A like protein n=1 Tax=Aduncisulcus paluster TaxID=2918883 RepID=A0ABQ5JRP2_9EUKA|nr:ABC transporter A like protein [Aduncisulcus paluster]
MFSLFLKTNFLLELRRYYASIIEVLVIPIVACLILSLVLNSPYGYSDSNIIEVSTPKLPNCDLVSEPDCLELIYYPSCEEARFFAEYLIEKEDINPTLVKAFDNETDMFDFFNKVENRHTLYKSGFYMEETSDSKNNSSTPVEISFNPLTHMINKAFPQIFNSTDLIPYGCDGESGDRCVWMDPGQIISKRAVEALAQLSGTDLLLNMTAALAPAKEAWFNGDSITHTGILYSANPYVCAFIFPIALFSTLMAFVDAGRNREQGVMNSIKLLSSKRFGTEMKWTLAQYVTCFTLGFLGLAVTFICLSIANIGDIPVHSTFSTILFYMFFLLLHYISMSYVFHRLARAQMLGIIFPTAVMVFVLLCTFSNYSNSDKRAENIAAFSTKDILYDLFFPGIPEINFFCDIGRLYSDDGILKSSLGDVEWRYTFGMLFSGFFWFGAFIVIELVCEIFEVIHRNSIRNNTNFNVNFDNNRKQHGDRVDGDTSTPKLCSFEEDQIIHESGSCDSSSSKTIVSVSHLAFCYDNPVLRFVRKVALGIDSCFSSSSKCKSKASDDTVPLLSSIEEKKGGRRVSERSAMDPQPGITGELAEYGTGTKSSKSKQSTKSTKGQKEKSGDYYDGKDKTMSKDSGLEDEEDTNMSCIERAFRATTPIFTDLSFTASTSTAILGKSGEGKTTLFSLLLNLNSPISGSISFSHSEDSYIGYMPQDSNELMFPWLDVRQHIQFAVSLRRNKWVPEEGDEVKMLIEKAQLDLAEHGRLTPLQMSGGMKRRLCLAIALAGDPSLVLLDEPTVGLDPVTRSNVWDTLRKISEDTPLLFSSHIVEEIEALAKNVVLIAGGNAVHQGSVIDLMKSGIAVEINLSKRGEIRKEMMMSRREQAGERHGECEDDRHLPPSFSARSLCSTHSSSDSSSSLLDDHHGHRDDSSSDISRHGGSSSFSLSKKCYRSIYRFLKHNQDEFKDVCVWCEDKIDDDDPLGYGIFGDHSRSHLDGTFSHSIAPPKVEVILLFLNRISDDYSSVQDFLGDSFRKIMGKLGISEEIVMLRAWKTAEAVAALSHKNMKVDYSDKERRKKEKRERKERKRREEEARRAQVSFEKRKKRDQKKEMKQKSQISGSNVSKTDDTSQIEKVHVVESGDMIDHEETLTHDSGSALLEMTSTGMVSSSDVSGLSTARSEALSTMSSVMPSCETSEMPSHITLERESSYYMEIECCCCLDVDQEKGGPRGRGVYCSMRCISILRNVVGFMAALLGPGLLYFGVFVVLTGGKPLYPYVREDQDMNELMKDILPYSHLYTSAEGCDQDILDSIGYAVNVGDISDNSGLMSWVAGHINSIPLEDIASSAELSSVLYEQGDKVFTSSQMDTWPASIDLPYSSFHFYQYSDIDTVSINISDSINRYSDIDPDNLDKRGQGSNSDKLDLFRSYLELLNLSKTLIVDSIPQEEVVSTSDVIVSDSFIHKYLFHFNLVCYKFSQCLDPLHNQDKQFTHSSSYFTDNNNSDPNNRMESTRDGLFVLANLQKCSDRILDDLTHDQRINRELLATIRQHISSILSIGNIMDYDYDNHSSLTDIDKELYGVYYLLERSLDPHAPLTVRSLHTAYLNVVQNFPIANSIAPPIGPSNMHQHSLLLDAFLKESTQGSISASLNVSLQFSGGYYPDVDLISIWVISMLIPWLFISILLSSQFKQFQSLSRYGGPDLVRPIYDVILLIPITIISILVILSIAWLFGVESLRSNGALPMVFLAVGSGIVVTISAYLVVMIVGSLPLTIILSMFLIVMSIMIGTMMPAYGETVDRDWWFLLIPFSLPILMFMRMIINGAVDGQIIPSPRISNHDLLLFATPNARKFLFIFGLCWVHLAVFCIIMVLRKLPGQLIKKLRDEKERKKENVPAESRDADNENGQLLLTFEEEKEMKKKPLSRRERRKKRRIQRDLINGKPSDLLLKADDMDDSSHIHTTALSATSILHDVEESIPAVVEEFARSGGLAFSHFENGPAALVCSGISKSYGKHRVLDNVSISMRRGERWALLARSGGGKTTLLNAICGDLPCDGGKVFIDGLPMTEKLSADKISIVGQENNLFPYLSVFEHVYALAHMNGNSRRHSRTMARRIINSLGFSLEDYDKKPKELSGGMKRRLSVAISLVNRGSVAFFDEVTVGLDVITKRSLVHSLKQACADKACLLTTHDTEVVEWFADNVFVLVDGKIVVQGPVSEVRDKSPWLVSIVNKRVMESLVKDLEKACLWHDCDEHSGVWKIMIKGPREKIKNLLSPYSLHISVQEPSLQSLFVLINKGFHYDESHS